MNYLISYSFTPSQLRFWNRIHDPPQKSHLHMSKRLELSLWFFSAAAPTQEDKQLFNLQSSVPIWKREKTSMDALMVHMIPLHTHK